MQERLPVFNSFSFIQLLFISRDGEFQVSNSAPEFTEAVPHFQESASPSSSYGGRQTRAQSLGQEPILKDHIPENLGIRNAMVL